MTATLVAVLATLFAAESRLGAVIQPVEARPDKTDLSVTKFECDLSGDRVVAMRSGGQVTWRQGGPRTLEFVLPTPRPGVTSATGELEALWCAPLGGDLLVLHRGQYLFKDGDAYAGGVLRVDGRTGKVLWAVPLNGANGPLRRGQYVYLSGFGMVAKVDVEAGRLEWSVDRLYRSPGLYLNFESPRLEDGRVIFPGLRRKFDAPWPATWPKALIVDDKTGSIVGGAPPPPGPDD